MKKKKQFRKRRYGLIILLGLILFTTGCLQKISDRTEYNITEVEGDGILKIIKLANYWTEDMFSIFFLIGLFTVAFISLKSSPNVDAKRSFAAASFITFLSALFLRLLDISKNNSMMDFAVFVSMIALIIGGIMLYFDRQESRF